MHRSGSVPGDGDKVPASEVEDCMKITRAIAGGESGSGPKYLWDPRAKVNTWRGKRVKEMLKGKDERTA